MARNKKDMDLAAIKDTINRTGEFRIHVIHGKSGMRTVARIWHWDGFEVGRANGCGYDKTGAALGDAVELFFQEELLKLSPGSKVWLEGRPERVAPPLAYYGLAHVETKKGWRASIDGSCGVESVLKILDALGFTAQRYETGRDSSMFLATREPRKVEG